ncbi:MAG: hypothetical protein MZU97_08715 [Bacillus subtilis]|nr:hypothetical protein [Bacillus subtilis]
MAAYFEGEQEGITIEIAMQYNEGYASNIYPFTNNIHNPEGGTYEEAFADFDASPASSTTTAVLPASSRRIESLLGEDTREGLVAIVSVKHPDPQFEGQTKAKLGLERRPPGRRKHHDRRAGALLARKPRRDPRDPGKSDHRWRSAPASPPRKRAGSGPPQKARSIRSASRPNWRTAVPATPRNRKSTSSKAIPPAVRPNRDAGPSTVAILPLRGKVLNVEKRLCLDKIRNKEILSMIQAFGTGIGREDFNSSTAARYPTRSLS